jgi:branched-subunit amino acid ABC-type transport system permease component
MDAIILQILNGLDKGSAYALIALGLTLIFGTLGVVNFAHGALFMIGAFCAVTLQAADPVAQPRRDRRDPKGLPRQSAEGRSALRP